MVNAAREAVTMNRREAIEKLESAGFICTGGTKHVRYTRGAVSVGLSLGKWRASEERAVREALKKAERREAVAP